MQSIVFQAFLLDLAEFLFFPVVVLVIGVVLSRLPSFRRGSGVLLVTFGSGELLFGFGGLLSISVRIGFSYYSLALLAIIFAVGLFSLINGIKCFYEIKPKIQQKQ